MGNYQIRPLSLGKRDLWSDGQIQLIHLFLDDDAKQTLYCIGKVTNTDWHPLLVQGKIGYACISQIDAQHICDVLNASSSPEKQPLSSVS